MTAPLPNTGMAATIPLALIGIATSVGGWIMTRVRR